MEGSDHELLLPRLSFPGPIRKGTSACCSGGISVSVYKGMNEMNIYVQSNYKLQSQHVNSNQQIR